MVAPMLYSCPKERLLSLSSSSLLLLMLLLLLLVSSLMVEAGVEAEVEEVARLKPRKGKCRFGGSGGGSADLLAFRFSAAVS